MLKNTSLRAIFFGTHSGDSRASSIGSKTGLWSHIFLCRMSLAGAIVYCTIRYIHCPQNVRPPISFSSPHSCNIFICNLWSLLHSRWWLTRFQFYSLCSRSAHKISNVLTHRWRHHTSDKSFLAFAKLHSRWFSVGKPGEIPLLTFRKVKHFCQYVWTPDALYVCVRSVALRCLRTASSTSGASLTCAIQCIRRLTLSAQKLTPKSSTFGQGTRSLRKF